ncbi:MAG TPA: hypothetical protein EYP56_14965 [Planctomycetaceae bacterium]|nr:hypothetical protein [Planctomycetaceae bacterium]
MNQLRRHLLRLGGLVAWVAVASSPADCIAAAESPRTAGAADGPGTEIPLRMGGAGGVYFLASPGQLVVEVEKRDRNQRGRHTELRAILFGPDRRVLAEAAIPDDGQPRGSGWGPPGRVRLTAHVARPGLYGLNVTISQDRYGQEIAWGFRTNCPKYVIETARGHKDEPHQEPIELLNPSCPADICFLPRPAALTIDVEGLPRGVEELTVYDAQGQGIGTLRVGSDRRARITFPAGEHRQAVPWRLHLPAAQAVVHIDGLTRWEPGEPYPDLCCWAPDPNAWFPFLEYRWLVTPYRRIVYGPAGSEGRVTFQLYNNGATKKTIDLQLEFPRERFPARVRPGQAQVPPRKSVEVVVNYTVPQGGKRHLCHLRARPSEDPQLSTYASLEIRTGQAPAARPLTMPIVLKPYQHENEQFGYLPDYPTESQVYFDLENRPFVRVRSGIQTLRDGRWVLVPLSSAVTDPPDLAGRSYGVASTKIAFDRHNDLYLLGTTGRTAVVLRSTDGGRTFSAAVIPGREDEPRSFDIEQFSGHNVSDGPPPVVRYTRTAADPRLRWRRIHDLELFLPEKRGRRMVVGDPVLISRRAIGLALHSGIPSTIVSRGDKVHVVWGEATDPDDDAPGVPTYVATYDRRAKKLSEPVLVAYGPPPNDIHNTPSITMDAEGYLHVLAGTHGQPFPCVRSRRPNDTQSGWTEAEPVSAGARQTYIGLVCGPDGTLHAAFRMWRSGVAPFPHSVHGTLAYQRKPPGQPWEAPRLLIVPPFSEYSVYYHRLTVDRRGRLFLSYDYWSTHWFYRNDHRGDRRALLLSPDGGSTWKLATHEDLHTAPDP